MLIIVGDFNLPDINWRDLRGRPFDLLGRGGGERGRALVYLKKILSLDIQGKKLVGSKGGLKNKLASKIGKKNNQALPQNLVKI